ncbi:hypothetical protein [Viridibacillus arvi]|uniref:hypothetical protein n=1 Tax=Viridibacillus arvi TaxID=263475 RepID=UPI003D024182
MILKTYQKDGYETIIYTIDGVNASSSVTFLIPDPNLETPEPPKSEPSLLERVEVLEDTVTEVITKVYE